MRILVLLVLGGSKWDSLPLVQVVVSDEYYLILLFVKTTLLFLLHTSLHLCLEGLKALISLNL